MRVLQLHSRVSNRIVRADRRRRNLAAQIGGSQLRLRETGLRLAELPDGQVVANSRVSACCTYF